MTNTPDELRKEFEKHGWIGVDLDGTLAHYTGGTKWDVLGTPVPAMLDRVKMWLAEGKDVRILTARVHPYIHGRGGFAVYAKTLRCILTGEMFSIMDMLTVIRAYTITHLGRALPVTCAKDIYMLEYWDDRCVQVIPNTGRTIEDELRASRLNQKQDYILPASASHGPR